MPRLQTQTTHVSRLPTFRAARVPRGTGPGPLNAAPASTDDTRVAPANVSRGPSGPGPLNATPRRPAQTTPVSRLPTFRTGCVRCGAWCMPWCVGFARPERARRTGPGPLKAAPASADDNCVAPANISRGPSARGTGPRPLNAVPATTNDTCVAPANVSRGPSARGAPVQGPYRCCACQHRRHPCRACQRSTRPE